MSVYAKQNGYTRFRFNSGSSGNGFTSFNLATGVVAASGGTYFFNSGIEDAGNGWFRCFMVLRGGSATNITIAIEDSSSQVSFTGDGTSGIHLWAAQSEDQLQPTTYLKSDGIAAVRKATTTNLLPYSEDFNLWHTANNVTITQDTTETTDPLGTNKADKILATSSSTPRRVFEVITTVSGSVYTGSVYAKKGTTDSIRLLTTSLIYDVTFNLTNLTITEDSGYGKIESVGNGWYRLQATGTSSLTTEVPQIQLSNSASTNEYLYLWGSQFEQQTQTETYAPTFGLPVTIDLFTENNYGTMTNMLAGDIVLDTPNNPA